MWEEPVCIISRYSTVPRDLVSPPLAIGVFKTQGVAALAVADRGDSSVSGKFSRTIDHYRFNEAKWTAFRFTYGVPLELASHEGEA